MQIQCIVNQPDRLLIVSSPRRHSWQSDFQFPISNFNSMQSRRWLWPPFWPKPLTGFACMYVCQLLTQNSHSHTHAAIRPDTHTLTQSTWANTRRSETQRQCQDSLMGVEGGVTVGVARGFEGLLLFWLFRHLNSLQLMREFVLISMLFSSQGSRESILVLEINWKLVYGFDIFHKLRCLRYIEAIITWIRLNQSITYILLKM